MWASIVKQLVEFEWIILASVFVGIAITILGSVLTKNLQWNQKRWKLLGIFCALNSRELLWLSFAILRYVFIVAVVAFSVDLELAQICYYAALCIGCIVLLPYVKRLVVDLVNSIVLFAALYMGYILNEYIEQVRSGQYTAIAILLAVFIVIYTTYFLFKDITEMLRGKSRDKDLGLRV